MPTNLPPNYFDVDKRFRKAQSPAEKIALLEKMISSVPNHKGTDKLQADLHRQLSRLKEEAQTRKHQGTHHSAFQIEREGVGQVAIIGPTNVGKSTLVTALTNASPEISLTPYTTWKPTPGMMTIESIQLKNGSTILDLAVEMHQDFADKLRSARVWGSTVIDG